MAGKCLLIQEQKGFILNNPKSIVKAESEVESARGVYNVKADELTIYVNMAGGKNYTIKGKRLQQLISVCAHLVAGRGN